MFEIVVLRGGALGDIILTLPVLQALRDNYPDCFITFVAPNPQAILARSHANRLLDLNSAKLLGLFSRDAALSDRALEYLKADAILSYLSDPEKVIERKLLGTATAQFVQGPFRLDLERRPASEQLARPLQQFGIGSIDPIPRLAGPPYIQASNRLAVHPGSGSPKKNWPLRHWTSLLIELAPAFDEILLIAGEADSGMVAALGSQIPFTKLRLCENRPLWELVTELNQASLFIGHDTGITHLAAATGIRTVALFGPTDPLIWAPNGNHVTVVQSPDGTMHGLSVEAVLDNLPRT